MQKLILLALAAAATCSTVTQAAQPAGGAAVSRQAKTDKADVERVLSRYKAAIEKLDPRGTEQLFAQDSTIFETGGAEGSYTNYLAHHLGPELKEFRSFRFSNYKLDVRFEGPIALATESYDYRIETKAGEVAERRGVATSVLKKIGGEWRILSMHNSARKPRAS